MAEQDRETTVDSGRSNCFGPAIYRVRPAMDSFLDAVQWPAMVVTLIAAWLVASQAKRKRSWGFWCFIASNILWVVWGWHDGAHALVFLQLGLFALNLRGARKNDPGEHSSA